MLSTAAVNQNLKDMLLELRATKKFASYLLTKISGGMPEQFMGAGEGDMSTEDESGIGGPEISAPDKGGPPAGGPPEEGQPEGNEFGGNDEEKKEKEIKTPDEAKKVVNEAITDLKAVVDGIDAID